MHNHCFYCYTGYFCLDTVKIALAIHFLRYYGVSSYSRHLRTYAFKL